MKMEFEKFEQESTMERMNEMDENTTSKPIALIDNQNDRQVQVGARRLAKERRRVTFKLPEHSTTVHPVNVRLLVLLALVAVVGHQVASCFLFGLSLSPRQAAPAPHDESDPQESLEFFHCRGLANSWTADDNFRQFHQIVMSAFDGCKSRNTRAVAYALDVVTEVCNKMQQRPQGHGAAARRALHEEQRTFMAKRRRDWTEYFYHHNVCARSSPSNGAGDFDDHHHDHAIPLAAKVDGHHDDSPTTSEQSLTSATDQSTAPDTSVDETPEGIEPKEAGEPIKVDEEVVELPDDNNEYEI